MKAAIWYLHAHFFFYTPTVKRSMRGKPEGRGSGLGRGSIIQFTNTKYFGKNIKEKGAQKIVGVQIATPKFIVN